MQAMLKMTVVLAGVLALAACQNSGFPNYPDQTVTSAPPSPQVQSFNDNADIDAYQDREEATLRNELVNSGINVARKGQAVILSVGNDIWFASDSAQVEPQARDSVHVIANVLRRYPGTHIDVDGFTDTTGSREHNLDLSRERADAVADLLARDGIEPGRIVTRGHGAEFLKVPTPDQTPEPLNRRVEITIEPYRG